MLLVHVHVHMYTSIHYTVVIASLYCPFSFIKKRVLLDTKLVRTILGDNWLHWNLYSVLKWTGIDETDIVYANFQSEVSILCNQWRHSLIISLQPISLSV